MLLARRISLNPVASFRWVEEGTKFRVRLHSATWQLDGEGIESSLTYKLQFSKSDPRERSRQWILPQRRGAVPFCNQFGTEVQSTSEERDFWINNVITKRGNSGAKKRVNWLSRESRGQKIKISLRDFQSISGAKRRNWNGEQGAMKRPNDTHKKSFTLWHAEPWQSDGSGG